MLSVKTMTYKHSILSLSYITVSTLKLAKRLKKEGVGIDAENSSHKTESSLTLTEMFKQPKFMNKNDLFSFVGPTRQPFTHMYKGYISLGTMLALGQIFKLDQFTWMFKTWKCFSHQKSMMKYSENPGLP